MSWDEKSSFSIFLGSNWGTISSVFCILAIAPAYKYEIFTYTIFESIILNFVLQIILLYTLVFGTVLVIYGAAKQEIGPPYEFATIEVLNFIPVINSLLNFKTNKKYLNIFYSLSLKVLNFVWKTYVLVAYSMGFIFMFFLATVYVVSFIFY